MTNQNSAAQAAEQDDIAQRLRDQANHYAQDPGYMADAALNRAAADEIDRLNAKLRAPVADEPPSGTRWPVLRAMARNYTAGKHTWDALDAEACEQAAEEIRHLRAALASAPVAVENRDGLRTLLAELPGMREDETKGDAVFRCGINGALNVVERRIRELLRSAPVAAPSDETLRLAGVIADKIEDGTLFQAGIFSRRELADKVRAVVRFVSEASAPVAGEAVAWKIYDAALGKHILTENPKVADMLLRAGGNTVRPLVYGDAAPQASAEDVRNAALEEAAALCDSWMMAKPSTHLQDMANQTMRRMADYIRALKTQADKDSGDAVIPASEDVVLPPLPSPPVHRGHGLFAGSQMQTYARAAVLADRQQRYVNTQDADVDIDRQQRAGDGKEPR